MTIAAKCFMCENYTEDMRCRAFPNGIPERVALNDHDHRNPYDGDNGIRFEPIDEGEQD